MNREVITIEDCLDMYEKKGKITVIKNGQVVGFKKEKAPKVEEHQRSQ